MKVQDNIDNNADKLVLEDDLRKKLIECEQNIQETTMQFSDLSYTLKSKGKKKPAREIQSKTYGVFKSGQVNAIVGPSGAGKTTLLNVLAQTIGQKQGTVDGSILINGKIVKNPMQIKSISGFLEQDDVFFTAFTPREILMFCAKMRIEGTNQKRADLVEGLIQDLNLSKCVDSKIGDFQKKGISGGEKRRISQAIELMMNPSIIFLDEPTSGQDSFTALQVMGVLKREANKGRMIVCSIHQPSYEILNIIDHIVVVAGGRNIYNGAPFDMINFIKEVTNIKFNGDYNPVEYLQKIIGNEKANDAAMKSKNNLMAEFAEDEVTLVDQLVTKNRDKFDAEHNDIGVIDAQEADIKQNFNAGFLAQFMLLSSRNYLMTFKDGKTLGALFGQSQFISIFGGLLFWQLSNDYVNKIGLPNQTIQMNRVGSLFFILINAYFPYQNYTGFRIVNDNVIVFKETRGQLYSASAYYWAKSTSDMFIFCIPVVLATIIGFFMTGIYLSWDSFLMILQSNVLLSIIGGSLGLFAGTTSTDIKAVIQIMPMFFVPFVLLAGFIINTSTLGFFKFLGYISPLKYAMELSMKAEFKNLPTKQYNFILDFFDYNIGTAYCIIIMVSIVVFFRLIAWIQIVNISKR